MLINLKMSCFRKHEDRTINFAGGLNAVRGRNEAGKTTMQTAILYALYGTKALPLPLEEMVTWGRAVKDLSVELTIKINGTMYLFKRSKNGAEVLLGDGTGDATTGQNEVTNFATKLLGADLKLAQKLMFAGQGDLRGALDSGATALSAYIEDLSGMDLFDVLLDLISTNLTTGPTATLDALVAQLEEKLKDGEPQKPDTEVIDGQIDTASQGVTDAQASLEQATAKATAATDALNEANTKASVKASVENSLTRARQTVADRKVSLAKLEIVAAMPVAVERIADLQQQLSDSNLAKVKHDAYVEWQKLPTDLDAVWEGDAASLALAIAEAEKTRQQAADRAAALSADIREANAKMVTSSVCGFCDQDMSKFPEVAKKNAELAALVAAKQKEVATATAARDAAASEKAELIAVRDSTGKQDAFLRKHSQYVEVDLNFVPPTIKWAGAIPNAGANPAALKGDLDAELAVQKDVATAVARLETVKASLVGEEAEVARLQAEFDALPEAASVAPVRQAKVDADQVVEDAKRLVARLQNDLTNIRQQRERRMMEFNLAVRDYATNEVALEKAREDRAKLVFNNTLVKKIKAARPVVAGKLWGILLASVTQMYTNMRGEASVVTKSKDDFLVNGKASKSYSGSALDLLGLAIRVALVKTFVPNCSFMLMDEAMAACDEFRTSDLLAFVTTAGFDQVLLITHEEVSSSMADNLILL